MACSYVGHEHVGSFPTQEQGSSRWCLRSITTVMRSAMRSVPITKLRVALLLLDVCTEPLRPIGARGIVAPQFMGQR